MAGMQIHPFELEVQLQGCRALGNLASDNDANQVKEFNLDPNPCIADSVRNCVGIPLSSLRVSCGRMSVR